jgi:hypothetical protein
MSLPAGLQNSHRNGARVFLIFVADPRTVRLYIFDSSVPQLHGKQAVSGFDFECKDTTLGSAVEATPT